MELLERVADLWKNNRKELLRAGNQITAAINQTQELVCVSGDGMPSELTAYLREHPADDLHVLLKSMKNAETLAECAPFTKDYPIPERGAMYYLCESGACKAPVSDFSQLHL